MIAHNYAQILEICDRVTLVQHGEVTFESQARRLRPKSSWRSSAANTAPPAPDEFAAALQRYAPKFLGCRLAENRVIGCSRYCAAASPATFSRCFSASI
jgi:ABC-type multidrug transport system ATPase subunit